MSEVDDLYKFFDDRTKILQKELADREVDITVGNAGAKAAKVQQPGEAASTEASNKDKSGAAGVVDAATQARQQYEEHAREHQQQY